MTKMIFAFVAFSLVFSLPLFAAENNEGQLVFTMPNVAKASSTPAAAKKGPMPAEEDMLEEQPMPAEPGMMEEEPMFPEPAMMEEGPMPPMAEKMGRMHKGMPMAGKGMMCAMCGNCPMMGKASMIATDDGGVIVLSGNKLMKYDGDLNLVKEVDIKMPPMEKMDKEETPMAEAGQGD